MAGASHHLAGRPGALGTREEAMPGLHLHKTSQGWVPCSPGLGSSRPLGGSRGVASRHFRARRKLLEGQCLPGAHHSAPHNPHRAERIPEADSRERPMGVWDASASWGLGLLGHLAVFATGIIGSLCHRPEVGVLWLGPGPPLPLMPTLSLAEITATTPGFRGHQCAQTPRLGFPSCLPALGSPSCPTSHTAWLWLPRPPHPLGSQARPLLPSVLVPRLSLGLRSQPSGTHWEPAGGGAGPSGRSREPGLPRLYPLSGLHLGISQA